MGAFLGPSHPVTPSPCRFASWKTTGSRRFWELGASAGRSVIRRGRGHVPLLCLQLPGGDLEMHECRQGDASREPLPPSNAQVWLNGMEVTQFTYFQQVRDWACTVFSWPFAGWRIGYHGARLFACV